MAHTTTKDSGEAIVQDAGGFPNWSHDYAAAWIGLLATHRRLTRELDAELEAAHGLTLSGLELLVRLASAPEHWLRLSALASEAGLSLSRVSRIVDVLESRGLIARRPRTREGGPVDAPRRRPRALLRPPRRRRDRNARSRFPALLARRGQRLFRLSRTTALTVGSPRYLALATMGPRLNSRR
jgi:DNA-binding MarR family transcriptional regulator